LARNCLCHLERIRGRENSAEFGREFNPSLKDIKTTARTTLAPQSTPHEKAGHDAVLDQWAALDLRRVGDLRPPRSCDGSRQTTLVLDSGEEVSGVVLVAALNALEPKLDGMMPPPMAA